MQNVTDKAPKGGGKTPPQNLRAKKAQIKTNGQMLVSDRTMPLWARLAGFIFTSITSLCWTALIMCSIFFFDLVIAPQNSDIALALFLVCFIPLFAIIVFDFAHVRALAGFRVARNRFANIVRAAIGAGLAIVLFVVHPLLGLGVVAGVGTLLGLWRLDRYLLSDDPLWEFNAAEVTSILSGRDNAGLRLAHKSNGQGEQSSLASTMQMISLGVAGAVVMTVASALVAQSLITPGAVLTCVLITLWACVCINQYITMLLSPNPFDQKTLSVSHLPLKMPAKAKGLVVHRLSVVCPQTGPLLQSVSFTTAPGKIVGVVGGAGDGKSLLFKAMNDPYDFAGLSVSGNVQFNSTSLWRSGTGGMYERNVPCVLVQSRPHLLPDTAMNNLTCFRSDIEIARVRQILGELVFSEDTVTRIMNAPNATLLSASEQKAVGLARAFLLSPGLYMFDRPEADADDAMINAIANKLRAECRAGASALVISDHRGLRENCDELLIMSQGTIVDSGPTEQITQRLESGWLRVIVARKLDSEETLHNWVRSHFRRFGDEDNRRNVCVIISELLAFSCISDPEQKEPSIMFEFKHEKGFCVLSMSDYGQVIGTTELTLARRTANDTKTRRVGVSPLSEIIRLSIGFEQEMNDAQRMLRVQIKTYDPRLNEEQKQASKDEITT